MSLPVFDKVRNSIEALDEKTRESLVKEVKGIFEFHIKDCNDTPSIYTLDLKNNQGSVLQGKGSDKADTVIMIADQDFVSLAGGKLSGKVCVCVCA
ncbi:uncharacterized protein EV154DRAFT_514500 [Mucor mucedo]|uniref:uncharacterized protein n=1 Tax=Mucor mucedo TaxID=29922 RepID=UPI00221FD041|nr:uncharacterized protein EV154DRAFT_514500 [Mucor mucedo]KAI7889518.1 hypothetical protein EV154DRAFT_514500 [Mucor mucedo]